MAGETDVRWIGERLQRLRKQRELTLQDVFDQTGIPVATLSRIERGAAKVLKSATLIALSSWMGISIEELTGKPSPVASKGKVVHKTPDIVELHLRADKDLPKEAALALAKLFRSTYEHLRELQNKKE